MKTRLLFLFCLMLMACQKEEAPLRIGANTWPGFEPLFWGRSLGVFDPEQYKMVEYINCMDVNRGFRNNNIDIAALTLDDVLSTLEDGHEPVILSVVDFSHGADLIAGDSSIQSIQDLKGKKIGVEPNSVSYYLLIRTLDSIGLGPKDVEIHFMQSSQLSDAFNNHQIQAAATYEPFYSEIKKHGAHEIISSKAFPYEIIDLLVTRRSYLEKYPVKVQDFLKKWYQIQDSSRLQPQRAISFMAQREGISTVEFQEALATLQLPTKADNQKLLTERQLIPTIQKVHTLMLKNKLLSQSNPNLESLLR